MDIFKDTLIENAAKYICGMKDQNQMVATKSKVDKEKYNKPKGKSQEGNYK